MREAPITLAWGRDWVRATLRGVVFAMGRHVSLGWTGDEPEGVDQ